MQQLTKKTALDPQTSVTATGTLMSSREIAELTGIQHNEVTCSAEMLVAGGALSTAVRHKSGQWDRAGQQHEEFWFDKRDSLVLIARVYPRCSGALAGAGAGRHQKKEQR